MNAFVTVISIILCTVLFAHLSLCANILAVTTLASPSHHIWHKPYFLDLVRNGHNVTVLGHDKDTNEIANFTMLTMEGVYEKIYMEFVLEELVHNGPLSSLKILWEWDEQICKYDLETLALKSLLDYPKAYTFDLIIWDLNGGRCLYPLIERFGNPPVIATTPFGLQPFMSYILGNHIFSYIPYFQSHTTDRMNFLDRLKNFMYVHLMNLSRKYYAVPREQKVAQAFFGNSIKPIDDVERNFSFLLANTDPVMNYAEPLPPNIIPVAGIHIQPPRELSKDWKTILDNAEHGVILVVFGTNLKWENFGEKQKQAYFEAFQKMPETILMKSTYASKNVPKNLIIKKWLPQSDILAHSNVKLFITHGGSLSTQEAMYNGVPVVGMPFFLDQHGNMVKIQQRKLGMTVNYFEVTPDVVYDTVREVIDNPIYRNNMQTLSKRYKDQPLTALKRAVYWTEYLLHHGSADHFSPATRDMNIFQRFDLDIAAVVLSVFVVLLATLYMLVKCLCDILALRKFKQSVKLKNN